MINKQVGQEDPLWKSDRRTEVEEHTEGLATEPDSSSQQVIMNWLVSNAEEEGKVLQECI